MNHLRFLLLVLFTLQIIVAVPPSPAYIALYRHNQYRLKHRVPPLKWNYQLAMHAQYWAEQCYLGHSSVTRPYSAGENIGLGYESIDKAIDHWYQESESYNYRTGHSNNGKETEHFTQVIWKATTDVGCGFAYCQNLRSSIYVCNYGPTGNVNSEYRDNVPLPI